MNEAAGGIGGVLNMMMDWGTREQQLRSHELMARYVMPVFQGSADSIVYSNQWSRERRDVLLLGWKLIWCVETHQRGLDAHESG